MKRISKELGYFVGSTLCEAEVGLLLAAPNIRRKGNVWELHPLVVRQDCRQQGVGRALVLDFERQVAERGGHTIRLGTDDENGRTSIGGIDIYPGVLDKVREIENLRQHPLIENSK